MAEASLMEAAIIPVVFTSLAEPIIRVEFSRVMAAIAAMGVSPTPVAQATCGVATISLLKAALLATADQPATWKDYPRSLARFASRSRAVLTIHGTDPLPSQLKDSRNQSKLSLILSAASTYGYKDQPLPAVHYACLARLSRHLPSLVSGLRAEP